MLKEDVKALKCISCKQIKSRKTGTDLVAINCGRSDHGEGSKLDCKICLQYTE